jgi:hypothetical protein
MALWPARLHWLLAAVMSDQMIAVASQAADDYDAVGDIMGEAKVSPIRGPFLRMWSHLHGGHVSRLPLQVTSLHPHHCYKLQLYSAQPVTDTQVSFRFCSFSLL